MEERKCKIIRNAIDINRNRLPYYLWDEYFTILEEKENCTTVKHGLRKGMLVPEPEVIELA